MMVNMIGILALARLHTLYKYSMLEQALSVYSHFSSAPALFRVLSRAFRLFLALH